MVNVSEDKLRETFGALDTDSVGRDSLVGALKVKAGVDADRAREIIQQGLAKGVLESEDGDIIYQETIGDGGEMQQKTDQYADVPQMLKDRDIWLLWDSDADAPRRPHWRGDFQISWNAPATWHSYEEAVEAAAEKDSWGIGYVNNYNNDDYPEGVITTIDIDGGLDEDGRLKDWVPQLDAFEDAYIEVSPSGNGLHIPVVGYEAPEWWRDTQFDDSDHEGVDVLSNKFCTCTGETFFGSGGEPADPQGGVNRWLAEVYREIEGKLPGQKDTSHGGEDLELTDEQIDEALSHIDPDCSYGEWRDIGFALVNHYGPGKKARRKFDQWSRGGSKYSEDGTKRVIKNIAEESKEDGGVTVGTLIHRAKQAGWKPDFGRDSTNGEKQPQKPENSVSEDSDGGQQCVEFTRDCVVRRAGYDPDETTVEDLDDTNVALGLERIIHDHENQHYRVVADSTEAIYAYSQGIWDDNAERHVKQLMRAAVPNKNSTRLHNQVCHQLRSDTRIMIDRDTLGAPAGTVATQDGLLDLLDGGIRELEPEDYAVNQLAAGYSPEADCPTFKNFVKDSCGVDDLRKLQEYAGYLLWQHAQPIGKACFLVGPTDSGKGTFIKAMKKVLGNENVSAQSLDDLVSTRWGPAHMYGKIANMRNEVKPDGVENIEMFKEITGGGDEITAEFKGEQKFQYTVTQKQLFSTNQFPIPDHADEAFWNRCLFAEFPVTVPDGEKDLRLLDKIEEEKEGILNWMLEGLRRLMDNAQFSDERTIDEKQEIAASYGSPLQRFKFNCLQLTGNTNDVVDRHDLHDVYAAFVKKELDRSEDDILDQGGLTKKLKKDDRVDKGRSRALSPGKDRDDVFKGVFVRQSILQRLGLEEIGQKTAAEDKGDGQTGLGR